MWSKGIYVVRSRPGIQSMILNEHQALCITSLIPQKHIFPIEPKSSSFLVVYFTQVSNSTVKLLQSKNNSSYQALLEASSKTVAAGMGTNYVKHVFHIWTVKMFVGRKHLGTKERKNLLRQVKSNCFWQPEQKNILWSIRRHAINDLILLTLPGISEQLLAGKKGGNVTGPLKKMLQRWLLLPLTAKPTIPTETAGVLTCSTRLIHWKLSSSEASGLCSATTTMRSS